MAPRLAVVAAVIAGSALGATLPASADTVLPTQTRAPATLVVNANQPFRPVTHVASGALYGLDTATVPADTLVEALHPNTFVQMAPGGSQLPNGEPSPGGDALVVAPEAAKAGANVVVRMSDWYPNFPYRWVSWSDWLSAVDTQVKAVMASGDSNISAFELWNEPDWTWDTADAGSFNAGWTRTYDEVKSVDPGAVIQGPSYSDNISGMQSFLANAVATNTVPDIISWHELESAGKIAGDVAAVTSIEKSLGITPRPIAIEEYATTSQVGVPGALVDYIAQFERLGISNAELAFWNHYGTLGDTLTDTGGSPNGAYWLYSWYGAMTGNMVTAVPAGTAGVGLDGAASVNAAKNEVDVIAGGGSGATAVKVTGLTALNLGGKVNVQLQYTPSAGRTTAVAAPITISDATYQVSNGSITVPIAMNASYGYHIVVTPENDNAVTTLKGTYHLTNLNSGLLLDTANQATAAGTPVDQYPASTSKSQYWILKDAGSGLYTIENQASGLLLGVSGESADKGAGALIEGDGNTPDQLWQVIPDGNGHYEIANYNSGLVLTLLKASTASGAQVIQWPDSQPNSGCDATGARVTGEIGGAVRLCGNGEYVSLPSGVVSGVTGDFTISAWVKPSANTTWSRIFDFGTGTSDYMFLTVSDGTELRFAITTGGAGGEQQIKGTGLLPLNTWSLVTVTVSGSTGTLYVNGKAVGMNASMTVHPSALGSTTQNWIGRSEYNDPYFSGAIDDFNIYSRALSATEVATLATGVAGAGDIADYKFDEAGGSTAVDSSGNGRSATIVSNQATVGFDNTSVNDQWWTLVPKK